jgi:hypothetical protein
LFVWQFYFLLWFWSRGGGSYGFERGSTHRRKVWGSVIQHLYLLSDSHAFMCVWTAYFSADIFAAHLWRGG